MFVLGRITQPKIPRHAERTGEHENPSGSQEDTQSFFALRPLDSTFHPKRCQRCPPRGCKGQPQHHRSRHPSCGPVPDRVKSAGSRGHWHPLVLHGQHQGWGVQQGGPTGCRAGACWHVKTGKKKQKNPPGLDFSAKILFSPASLAANTLFPPRPRDRGGGQRTAGWEKKVLVGGGSGSRNCLDSVEGARHWPGAQI